MRSVLRNLLTRRFEQQRSVGRRGLVSLGSVDSAYFGGLDNWGACAQRLSAAGWLSASDAVKLCVRYQFGRLIANSDMHFGNCSLHFTDAMPFALAPNYDMLPMLFMPRGLELPEVIFSPPRIGGTGFEQARTLAQHFWRAVTDSPRISSAFKAIASDILTRF